MTVRAGALDMKGIGEKQGGGVRDRSGKSGAESIDLLGAEMRDIADGASLDLASLAVGFAEEESGRRVSIGHGGDVHAYTITHKQAQNTHKSIIYMPTKIGAKPCFSFTINDLGGFSSRTSD